jgi:hypothetical protein
MLVLTVVTRFASRADLNTTTVGVAFLDPTTLVCSFSASLALAHGPGSVTAAAATLLLATSRFCARTLCARHRTRQRTSWSRRRCGSSRDVKPSEVGADPEFNLDVQSLILAVKQSLARGGTQTAP